jgi:hypothetical protein
MAVEIHVKAMNELQIVKHLFDAPNNIDIKPRNIIKSMLHLGLSFLLTLYVNSL